MLKKHKNILNHIKRLVFVAPAFFVFACSSGSEAEEYYILYEQALKNGETRKAYEHCLKALKLDSNNVLYLAKMSSLAKHSGNISFYSKLVDRAYNLDSTNVEILLEKALLSLYKGQIQQSILYANNALKINRYIDQAYFIKGACYKYVNDTIKAKSSFLTATEINPNNFDAFYELGVLLGKSSEAKAFFESALSIKPDDLHTLRALGWWCQVKENFDEALSYYKKAIGLNRQAVDFYSAGLVCLNDNALTLAKDYLQTAIELNALNEELTSKYYYDYLVVLKLLGEVEKYDKLLDSLTTIVFPKDSLIHSLKN